MIVRDTDILTKYISSNASLKHETLEPYILRAERKHIKALIGKDQYAVFDTATPPTNEFVKEAWEMAANAVSNFAMYYALPILKAQVSENGIVVADSEYTSQASDKDFKELQRSFKTAGHEALDEMFKVMEQNKSEFSAWTDSDEYKEYNSLLVNTTSIFQKHYNIQHSRQTFMALLPEIKIVEKQYIRSVIGSDLLTALKTDQTEDKRKEVKSLLQQAIVCYTIAKTLTNGLFKLSESGIHIRFDVLPYEKVYDSKTVSEFIVESRKNKITEAEQLLAEAVQVIQENSTDFSEYTMPEESDSDDPITHNTKSITLL